MAAAGTVAVILPGAFYFIRETQKPPIELFRQHGVPMAIATDCNPGTSPLTSLLLTMNMAATLFRMTVEECIAGVTREAARALGMPDRCRDARGGQDRRPRNLGHRAARGARLPHGLQPASRPHLEGPMTAIILKPGDVSLAAWRSVLEGAVPALDPSCAAVVSGSAAAVDRILAKGEPVYGINTGFGKLASVRIADRDLETLQSNIVLSHAAGVGEPMPVPVARLMMALKLASLAQGASGIRPATLALLEDMLAKGIMPGRTCAGLGRSVGRSCAACPYDGRDDRSRRGVHARRAVCPLARRSPLPGSPPVVLGPKEGLALLNGTQFSTALRAGGPVWRRNAAAGGAGDRSAIDGRRARLRRAVRPAHP